VKKKNMSKRTVYHVTPAQAGWKVKAEGADRARVVTDTKAEAVGAARTIGNNEKPAQVVIHGRDGVIQTEHTYGSDPEKYKG
jgi:hypothetical protein